MPRERSSFDDAVRALARARSLHARLDALADLIFHLYGIRQLTPARKLPPRGALPLAIRWFNANYSRSRRVRGGFNRVPLERELAPWACGVLPLLYEPAGAFFLGFRPGRVDPKLLGTHDDPDEAQSWWEESVTVSQALAAHVLFEFAYCSPNAVEAMRALPASLRFATKGMTPLPIGWRTAWDLHLWAGRGVVVAGLRGSSRRRKRGKLTWHIVASARRRADLAYLKPIRVTWDLDHPGGRPF